MKALLDTNIIIHREAGRVVNSDIGILYKYLDKARYEKCIHPETISEIKKNPNKATVKTFLTKLESYTELLSPAPIHPSVGDVSDKIDITDNDKLDSRLLNEVFCDRVDILISEDKKIHKKASLLGIADRVFKIESFLEKITSEYPELVDYKVLSVRQSLFGKVNLDDPFFDSFKEDYPSFEKWFNRKANERVYITFNNSNKRLLSFLYLKREDRDEVYSNISPIFKPKRRLKIGTFKVVSNGVRLGERFMKIVFDNALANKVEEIYVTIYDKREEQQRLIELLQMWGFKYWGTKDENELVYVRDFARTFNVKHPRLSYPYISKSSRFFLVPIYPAYHTELFPDSILRTESPLDFIENEPHRNGISKVYVSRSIYRDLKRGDVIVFYRTGGIYKGVVSTICLTEDVIHQFKNEEDFIKACRRRSVFSEDSLRSQWRYRSGSRPFVVSMLYVYSFPKRTNLKGLIDNGILSGVDNVPRGFQEISKVKFETIVKLTQTDESFILD